jgi:hypothetical protein
MAATSDLTLENAPRRSLRSVSSLNQRSTKLSHELDDGPLATSPGNSKAKNSL